MKSSKLVTDVILLGLSIVAWLVLLYKRRKEVRERVQSVKNHVKESILKEAEDYLGTAMTFSLFESVKEKLNQLTVEQPEKLVETVQQIQDLTIQNKEDVITVKKSVVKKEHLSKAQKRKQWDRVDSKGDKPRGADWVDIIKHLSQTGPKVPAIGTVASPTS